MCLIMVEQWNPLVPFTYHKENLLPKKKLFSLFLTPFVLSPKGMLRVFNMTLDGRSHFGKAELLQLNRTQFPSLGIFVSKKVGN